MISATRSLVAERGPDGFSVRDIAGRAGVNHALVHRHFGTKAEVLEQTLAAEAEAVVAAVVGSGLPTSRNADVDVIADLLNLLADRPSYWRTMVHAVLDSPEAVVPGTAATTELFAGLWGRRGADDGVQWSVAGVSVLGWLIFGKFITDANGTDPEDVRRAVAAQVAALIAPDNPDQP